MSVLLVVAAVAHAACPAHPTDLATAAEDGAAAWEARAPLDVIAARDRALVAAECLDAVPTPDQAARLHGLDAMAAFMQRDLDAASASARASLHADPGYVLPVELVPGHPLRALFDAARTATSDRSAPLPEVRGRSWMADGAPATERSLDRPALLVLTDEQAVLWSDRVRGDTVLPDLAHLGEAERRRRPIALAAGSTVALALTTGVLYGVGRATSDRYHDPATRLEDLDGLRQRTNTLGRASTVTGLAALGAGAVTLVVALP